MNVHRKDYLEDTTYGNLCAGDTFSFYDAIDPDEVCIKTVRSGLAVRLSDGAIYDNLNGEAVVYVVSSDVYV